MTFTGNCFRCGEPGHVAAFCDELRPARSRQEHEARLNAYKQRFMNWLTPGSTGVKWTREEKTRAIEMENRMYEKEKAKK
jgi:hypothetical protein